MSPIPSQFQYAQTQETGREVAVRDTVMVHVRNILQVSRVRCVPPTHAQCPALVGRFYRA